MLDKREIVAQFRERLEQLIERRGENLSAFARRCHMDRSALSQFLDAKVSRLPRAETLCTIAAAEAVSVDWLLGLSQSERSLGEVARVVSIETAEDGIAESRLAEWHREAIGYKIRYVPATLPDLLRTQAVLNYEFRSEQPALRDAKTGQARQQLDYSRRPETDMEIVMRVSGPTCRAGRALPRSSTWRNCWKSSTRRCDCSSMTVSRPIRRRSPCSDRNAQRSISARCIWWSTRSSISAR
jgi:transcriptional regulator with XRE-family HTH domain